MPEKVESNYDANSLRALKGLEPVREHPGMYIGPTDEKGLHCLVREVIDNSIDEALAGYCDTVNVVITEDGSCSIKDNGRGIPTGINADAGISGVELALTNLNAGGKFGGGTRRAAIKYHRGFTAWAFLALTLFRIRLSPRYARTDIFTNRYITAVFPKNP